MQVCQQDHQWSEKTLRREDKEVGLGTDCQGLVGCQLLFCVTWEGARSLEKSGEMIRMTFLMDHFGYWGLNKLQCSSRTGQKVQLEDYSNNLSDRFLFFLFFFFSYNIDIEYGHMPVYNANSVHMT